MVLGTLIAFPMLENVVLKDIGTAATAALNSALSHLSFRPLFFRSFSKKNVLARMLSTSKFPSSIYLFILRQKRAIALCETEHSLAACAIAPRSNSPSFKQLWRKIKAP